MIRNRQGKRLRLHRSLFYSDEPPPPPPKPDPPYIQAYKNRRRIPFWAMPALLGLPLWAFIYANTLETPPNPDQAPGQANPPV